MMRVTVLAKVLDVLHLARRGEQPTSLPVRPMSDRQLALAISELKRTPTTERAKQRRTSAIAELRRLQHAINADDARNAERTKVVYDEAIKLLRDPAPDTFLGRKTQEPFPKKDKE